MHPVAVSIHAVRVGSDSDLLFKDPPSGLTLHRDSDKEIKYVVVALPELIDKDRFFPEVKWPYRLLHLRTPSRQ